MNTRIARRTQAERKAESDQRMIQAAIELFAEQGYVRTTLNDIGSRAGYTGGLVSKRYGSKQALLSAVLDELYRSFTRDSMTEVSRTESVVEGLATYVQTFLRRLSRNNAQLRALYLIMGESLGAVPEMRSEIAAFNKQTIRAIGNLLQQGAENGELRQDLVVREAAASVLALLRGVTTLYLTDPGSFSLDKVEQEVGLMLKSMENGKAKKRKNGPNRKNVNSENTK